MVGSSQNTAQFFENLLELFCDLWELCALHGLGGSVGLGSWDGLWAPDSHSQPTPPLSKRELLIL